MQHFLHEGALILDCFCGRTAFEENQGQDWEDGEYEKLLSNHQSDPDRYILCPYGIHFGRFRNAQVVYECTCGLSARLEEYFTPNCDIVALLNSGDHVNHRVRPFGLVSEDVLRSNVPDGELITLEEWLLSSKKKIFHYLNLCNSSFLLEEISEFGETGAAIAAHLLNWLREKYPGQRELASHLESSSPNDLENTLIMASYVASRNFNRGGISRSVLMGFNARLDRLAKDHGIALPEDPKYF